MSSSSLKPRTQARGVIPEKVSDLENDLLFITRKELDEITNLGGYTGLENDTAKVEVDNTYKTIEVFSKDNLKQKLPKNSSGEYVDGTYTLRASVVNGIPTIEWRSSSEPVEPDTPDEPVEPTPTDYYYYGLVNIDEVEDLTSSLVKGLTKVNSIKADKEYKFVASNQRAVMAYPSKFGELSSIVHKETGFTVTSMFERINLNIDGVAYYAYISYNPSTGTYTYKFSY